MAKKKKVRVDLRKNRANPPRTQQWTRDFKEHGFSEEGTKGGERVRAKGDLSRRRTIMQTETPTAAEQAGDMPAVDAGLCLSGRVVRIHKFVSVVEVEDGRQFRCAVRGLLRSLAIDERNILATGDQVWIRPGHEGASPAAAAPGGGGSVLDGFIERVEPRHGVLTRSSRRREQVLVANVDQLVIVMSLVEPDLKPHLIDRYLASAAKGGIQPVICLNKADLVEPAAYQPLVGLYNQLGIPTFLTSARSGMGIWALKERLHGRQTVFSGQSGVGKSSLLNAVEPGLGLRVREVSEVNQKGQHTTTHAELIRLNLGGWVVDTPGIRQFQLWDIIPEEVERFFPEFHPFIPLCGFPDCSHTHEEHCAVNARWIAGRSARRGITAIWGCSRGRGRESDGLKPGNISSRYPQRLTRCAIALFQLHRHAQIERQPERHDRQGLAQFQRRGPGLHARRFSDSNWPVSNNIQPGGRMPRRSPGLYLQRCQHFFVQVGCPRRNDIHDYDRDPVLEVAGTLGGKGPPAAGAVLVRRANQLNGSPQLRAVKVLVNQDLKAIEMGVVHLGRELRARRRPDRGSAVNTTPSGPSRLQCRNVDFKIRPDANLRLRKVIGRQRALVEMLRYHGSPGVMKALPTSGTVQRRMEVVEKRHIHLGKGLFERDPTARCSTTPQFPPVIPFTIAMKPSTSRIGG